VTANLSSRQVQVLDSGPLASAVRASIAIPAIFKPTIENKDVVVDGGILSPLPIRALHQAGAHKVIAVNVFPSLQDMAERRLILEENQDKEKSRAEKRGPAAKTWWALKKMVAKKVSPNIFDILMMTIQSMEAEIADVEGEEADILLRPVLANASWMDMHKPRPFIQRGEEEAVKFLAKIKALVAQQNN
jgi:NTE family protein